MLEIERHRIILSAVQERPVVTVADLCALTTASEATVRRDIAQLHLAKKLRRVRGGAEAISPPQVVGINARPFAVDRSEVRITVLSGSRGVDIRGCEGR